MTTKNTDRRALMRASMKAEETSVEKRFAAAEAAMERAPSGLAGSFPTPTRGALSTTFSAESTATLRALPEQRILKKIPLDFVLDNPFNARQIYNPDVIKERAASIATHGQRVPALACEDWNHPGKYILIDGHYRKRAIQAAGKSEIECLIEPIANELELYR